MNEFILYLLSLSFLLNGTGHGVKDKNQLEEEQSSIIEEDVIREPDIHDEEEQLKDAEDHHTEITISAVGDCTLGRDDRGSYSYSLPYYLEINQYDYSYFFRGVYDILSQDDLTIANLEGTFTDSNTRADKQFAFKGDASYTNILTEGSVEAVNLANNHTMDYGTEGYEDTKVALDQAGISYFGNGIYEIMDVDGIKVGLAGIKGFGISDAKANIDAAKEYFSQNDVDLIIYNFRWGIEREYEQNSNQEEIARYAVDHGGANLVIGHHPHVLQGIEKYNGVYIVYSLGNFVFGGNKNPSDKYTMILQMTFSFEDQELTDAKINIIPATLSSTMSTNDYQPTVASSDTQELILRRVLDHSTNFTEDDLK